MRSGGVLPAGDLVVAPNWNAAQDESRSWGMAVALRVRPYLRLTFLIGMGLVVAAVVVGNWRTV